MTLKLTKGHLNYRYSIGHTTLPILIVCTPCLKKRPTFALL